MYWYLLILKGLKRMLEQLGVLKQSENADYNDLEKYEASATVELLPKDKV